ncbi:Rieske 2Fe-2S domain-containing protein [Cupriavidus necator]
MHTTVASDFDASAHWFPVAVSGDIRQGEITQAFLAGQELALWRSADGTVHAWENRCPHRGTRFTLGRIIDDTLSCAYHGWRFEPTGQCTLIPANPTLTPPRNACAKAFATHEADGFVWATLGTAAWTPRVPAAAATAHCRAFVVEAAAQSVRERLLEHPAYGYRSAGAAVVSATDADGQATLAYLTPMSAERTLVHLVLAGAGAAAPGAAERLRAAQSFKPRRVYAEAAGAENRP